MNFEASQKETIVLDPGNNMATKAIPSEIRKDPLTGRSARICHFMKLQWEKPDFEKMVAGTEKMCPFCPDKVMNITPSFPEDILPEGRLISDDMILFPNIAPYDSLGAVATLGSRHYIPMIEIDAGRIFKGFKLAMDFFRKIHQKKHPESVYHLVNWNYMPPAGSSLIHPHLQVFATSSGPNLMREELEAAGAYMQANGSNYWVDLAKAEKADKKRFLGTIGRITWLSAYAPMGVAGDVLAIHKDALSTLELTDDDLYDMATGLTRLMAAYDQMGVYSFNMNFFSGAATDDHSRFHLLFSPRTFFNQALGTPDIGALRNLYNETLCMAFPEDINTRLRPYF
jgi:galactose-1-phosphate uridylyltransferase